MDTNEIAKRFMDQIIMLQKENAILRAAVKAAGEVCDPTEEAEGGIGPKWSLSTRIERCADALAKLRKYDDAP